jgi:hypothetical protein
MENNTLSLSDRLIVLLSERRVNAKEKMRCVTNQKYEEAAKARDIEKKLTVEILQLISEEGKYDFSKSKQVKTDILAILDLVEDGDVDFSNALQKLPTQDMERLKIMKDIERYNLGQISLDELHAGIKKSFQAVIRDFKNKVLTL